MILSFLGSTCTERNQDFVYKGFVFSGSWCRNLGNSRTFGTTPLGDRFAKDITEVKTDSDAVRLHPYLYKTGETFVGSVVCSCFPQMSWFRLSPRFPELLVWRKLKLRWLCFPLDGGCDYRWR